MRKEKLEQLENIIEGYKCYFKNKIGVPSKFIRSEVYECFLNNGKIITREKIVKGGKDGSACVILPVTTDSNVILTVEPRVFSKTTVGVGIPAGYIEKNEDPYVAALRELEEETGYVPNELISLGGFYQDMGCSAAYNRAYMAIDCEKKYNQNLDWGEYITYFDCTFDEALELVELGYVQGCNAIITLERAKQFIKKRG